LKFDSVLVRDSEGDRRFSIAKLPLRLGTGSDCVIRLPGPGSAAVALLDELDGQAFVQPLGRNAALTINDQPLTATRRLAAGDVIGFYGSRVLIREESTALVCEIQLEDSAYVTRPPDVGAAAGRAPEELIAPTVFQRKREVGIIEDRPPRWRWQHAVAAGIVALLLLSYLLFSARSIKFDVQPAEPDELSISGGWFSMPFGDRVLMREGSYVVHVKKKGYYDVDPALQGDEHPSRTVLIELRKLPGHLTVATDPMVDALVTVDDTQIGKAPFGPIELEPGSHSVAVAAEGYLPFADTMAIPGLGRHQQVSVQLVPRWATSNHDRTCRRHDLQRCRSTRPDAGYIATAGRQPHPVCCARRIQGLGRDSRDAAERTPDPAAHPAGASQCPAAGQYHSARRERNSERALSRPGPAAHRIVTGYRLRHRPVESRLRFHRAQGPADRRRSRGYYG
jgi:hypothetical protein